MNTNGTTDLITMRHTLRTLQAELLLERSRFAHVAGLTFGGERDLYEICGYKRELTYRDYRARYERGGIAARIIDAFPAATWQNPPTVREVKKDDESVASPFEMACEQLITRLRLWAEFERVDRLASIGHYAVLLVGLRGQADLQLPVGMVQRPEDMIYLASYSEEHARIAALEMNADSPRFGKPALYEIDFTRGGRFFNNPGLLPSVTGERGSSKTLVHASRVLHVAENGIEDTILAQPSLRAIWNDLDELDKVKSGSAEMIWRDAKGRFHMGLRDGAYLSPEDAAALEDKIQEMIHGMRDMIQTSGIDLNKLAGTVIDVSRDIDKRLDIIAGTKRMPKRLLIGSERGELSSAQDENNWGDVTIRRQMNFGTPVLARPFFDLAIRIGAVPMPRQGLDGYALDWPDPKPLTQMEESLIALNWVKVFQTYASVSDRSIQEILPPEILYKEIAGYDEEQITRILELAAQYAEEREAHEAEERDMQEEIMRERTQGRGPQGRVAA